MDTTGPDLFRSLGRIESKLDSVAAQVGAINDRMDLMEPRISALERWRSMLIGAWVVASTILAWLAGLVFTHSKD